ncbi:hypothetical protein PAMP_007695 [Pampus punctatissimus]
MEAHPPLSSTLPPSLHPANPPNLKKRTCVYMQALLSDHFLSEMSRHGLTTESRMIQSERGGDLILPPPSHLSSSFARCGSALTVVRPGG